MALLAFAAFGSESELFTYYVRFERAALPGQTELTLTQRVDQLNKTYINLTQLSEAGLDLDLEMF